jgi:ribosomal protein S18 acetylase RimI-like enzyme
MTPFAESLPIERLTIKDLDQLVELAQKTWLETFTQGLSPADIDDALRGRDHDHFLGCMDEDEIWLFRLDQSLAGFIHFGSSHVANTSRQDIEIRKLYVAKQHQSLGIGRKLMNFALDNPSLQSKRFYLDVWSENRKAIHLYQSLGFEIISERVFQTENGPSATPDFIMRRERKEAQARAT